MKKHILIVEDEEHLAEALAQTDEEVEANYEFFLNHLLGEENTRVDQLLGSLRSIPYLERIERTVPQPRLIVDISESFDRIEYRAALVMAEIAEGE